MAGREKRLKTAKGGVQVFKGSGNVFADLGYPNPEEALNKARIAYRISELIEEKKLTQTEAASLLGVDQPKVSKIRKGQIRDFSIERLLRFVSAMGENVEVIISSPKNAQRKKTVRFPLFRKRAKLPRQKAA